MTAEEQGLQPEELSLNDIMESLLGIHARLFQQGLEQDSINKKLEAIENRTANIFILYSKLLKEMENKKWK